MVFYGEYVVALTQGMRLVLPKKLRELIKGNEFVITKGFDKCLSGYDAKDWNERSKEYLTSSLINKENLELRRIIFSGALYIELDEQGRFVLPKSLYDYLKLKEKAVFVGVGDHFEMWSTENWRKYLAAAQTATDLLDLGS